MKKRGRPKISCKDRRDFRLAVTVNKDILKFLKERSKINETSIAGYIYSIIQEHKNDLDLPCSRGGNDDNPNLFKKYKEC